MGFKITGITIVNKLSPTKDKPSPLPSFAERRSLLSKVTCFQYTKSRKVNIRGDAWDCFPNGINIVIPRTRGRQGDLCLRGQVGYGSTQSFKGSLSEECTKGLLNDECWRKRMRDRSIEILAKGINNMCKLLLSSLSTLKTVKCFINKGKCVIGNQIALVEECPKRTD